jgi:hypothetical protein
VRELGFERLDDLHSDVRTLLLLLLLRDRVALSLCSRIARAASNRRVWVGIVRLYGTDTDARMRSLHSDGETAAEEQKDGRERSEHSE